MTNDFQITPECPNCAAAKEALDACAERFERIKEKALKAKKEIYGSWCGDAYELYKEIMGVEF